VRAIGRLGWAYASTKERPAPPKTDPSRSGRGGRSPGAAGEGAFGPNVVASPTGPAAAHSSPITRRTDRTEPIEHRPRPTPPSASRPYFRFLARPTPASLRVASMVDPPVSQHIPIHASHPPRPRCRRPAPGPPAPAWANPPHIYLARRGRGASATRWPPFLESPGGKRKTTVGGAAARSRLRRTPRNEHQETNTKRRTGSRRPRYRVHANAAAANRFKCGYRDAHQSLRSQLSLHPTANCEES
jgi:hypothetical protein